MSDTRNAVIHSARKEVAYRNGFVPNKEIAIIRQRLTAANALIQCGCDEEAACMLHTALELLFRYQSSDTTVVIPDTVHNLRVIAHKTSAVCVVPNHEFSLVEEMNDWGTKSLYKVTERTVPEVQSAFIRVKACCDRIFGFDIFS